MEPPGDGPRIQTATRAYEDHEVGSVLEPEVSRWFRGRFAGFTPPQRYAVKELHDRNNVLISSPTGSGKTLSAFLAAINELVHEAKQGALEDRVYVLYVSPLKALNNDIGRNLEGPLAGILDELEAAGHGRPDIRVGVRTGDTSRSERAKMTRTPPHILITTPESLAIVLAAPKFSEHLARVNWIIVDEVHALAENKRGSHLMLSLERVAHAARAASEDGVTEPVRIGLSATIEPLDQVARFLVGRGADGRPRSCLVVDVSYTKELELEVLCPLDELVAPDPDDVQRKLYDELDRLIEEHRTTLIFTNTRAGTERVVHHLADRFGDKYADLVGAHHGSMSKAHRLDVEERLKAGELKAVATSTSLELGIDIGYVDLVVLLSSPKGIARTLQRIGRSGHQLHETSKGVLVALDRDDLVECTVIAQRAREGRLDALRIPRGGLDVLCQHLVGLSIDRVWDVDEAFELVRRAEPYHDLAAETFEACLAYLAGKAHLDDKRVYAKLWYDPDERKMGRRGSKARPIYYTNVGVIPDSTQIRVVAGDNAVGNIDEEFIESLSKGDVFTLGGKTWQYRGATPVQALVAPAASQRPTVPQWYSEQLPVTFELAQAVARFRRELADRLVDDGFQAAVDHVAHTYQLEPRVARLVVDYVAEQAAFSAVPDATNALVEEHEADDGRTHYVFHASIGRKGNEALARAFAHRVERSKGFKVPYMVGDHGFVLTLPILKKLRVQEVRGLFLMDLVRELHEALDDAELMRRRFRHVAARSFMILRNYLGNRVSVGRQNANARKLLTHLKRVEPDSPVLTETYREVLHDALDLTNAREHLFGFVSKQADIRFVRDLPGPSPFAFNLMAASSANAVLAAERRDVLAGFQAKVDAFLAGGPAADGPVPTEAGPSGGTASGP